MPGPATAATLAAVRRAWGSGFTVRVVSFRTGAADISVPVVGPLAGWRLEHIRRHYGAPAHVVLGLQPGVPFSDLRPAQQVATTAGLAIALRRFKRATLLVGEDPGLMPGCFRALVYCADECIVGSDEARRGLEERYNLRPGTVTVEEVEPYPSFPAGADPLAGGLYRPGLRPGLTVVELPTTTLAQRARARLTRSTFLRRFVTH
jgi:hypothetical protein